MPYFSPYIDETGLHIPTYTDLRDQLIQETKGIYGEDIYIDPDSADYQLISIVSKKIFDSYSLAQLVYNNRTPITAIGVGLDNNVAFANIKRKPATASTVQLTLSGEAGTKITNAQAGDSSNNKWNIPDCIIDEHGSITVEATCSELGSIGAPINTITNILTPIFGWYSVNNPYAATLGSDTETDAELRGRYSLAIRSPSYTVFDSMLAGVEEVPGVNRVSGYENDTGNVSTGTVPPNIPSGLPPHSVTFVVEGGEDKAIAENIYNKKTPGCYTNGDVSVELISEAGNINTIRFYRPTYIPVYATITVKKFSNWNDDIPNKIKSLVSEYINTLNIGDDVYMSLVWSVAIGAMDSINNPSFSITGVKLGTSSTSQSTSDISIDFNNVAQCTADNVTVVTT